MLLHILATGLLCISSSTRAARIPAAQTIPAIIPTPAAKVHEVHLPDSFISDLSSEKVCIDTGIGDCESASKPYLSLNVSVSNEELFVNNERVFPPSIPPRLHALRKWTSEDTSSSSSSNKKTERVVLAYALGVRPLAIDEISSTTEDGWMIRVEFFDMHARRATPNVIRVDLEREANSVNPETKGGGERGGGGLVMSKIIVHPLHMDRWGGRPKKLPWEAKYWQIKDHGRNRDKECFNPDSFVADEHEHEHEGDEERESTDQEGKKPDNPINLLKNKYVHGEAIQELQQSVALRDLHAELVPRKLICLVVGAVCVMSILAITGTIVRKCIRRTRRNGSRTTACMESQLLNSDWELNGSCCCSSCSSDGDLEKGGGGKSEDGDGDRDGDGDDEDGEEEARGHYSKGCARDDKVE